MKMKRIVEWAVAVLFFAIFSFMILSGFFDGLENRTLYWRYRDRPKQDTKAKISLVLISDDCLMRLGNWPVPRSFYASIVDRLASAGVRLIAFDIIFEEPATADPVGDELFVNSCRSFGRVVFPAVFTEQHVFDGSTGEMLLLEEVRPPFKALAAACAGFGFINADFVFLNPDGVLQKTFLARRHKEKWVANFPLAIAEVMSGQKALIGDDGIKLNGQYLPVVDLPPIKNAEGSWNAENGKAIHINFLGTQFQEPFPIYSFADIIEGKYDPALLRDAIVFVGPSAVGLGDIKLTPHGLKPGVLVHATLLENILSANYLQSASIQLQLILLALFALFTLGILRIEKPFTLVTFIYALILLGYSAICYYFFSYKQLILPLTVPILMSAGLYIVVRFFQLFANLKIANDILRGQNIQLDHQIHELMTLHHAGSKLPAILDMPVLSAAIIEKFCELRSADAGLLVYFEPGTEQPQYIGQFAGGKVENNVEKNRAELTLSLDAVLKQKKLIRTPESPIFTVYMPILVGGSCWGAVCLQESPLSDNPVHSDYFWETMLGISGTALENARLYEMAREVSLARVVQANFLPQQPLSFNGYTVSGSSRPATQLGGDYFDYFTFNDRYLVVIIADVMGHGVPAALGMTIVKTSVLQRAKEKFSIEALIDTINNTLINIQKQRLMVTAQFTLIDTLEHKVAVYHRGHVFPLKRDLTGGWSQITCIIAPPLGVKKKDSTPATPIEIKPGERMLFLTDGIYESIAGEEGDLTKITSFQNYLSTRPQVAIDAVCADILDHHPSVLSGLPQPDDYTVLMLEREL